MVAFELSSRVAEKTASPLHALVSTDEGLHCQNILFYVDLSATRVLSLKTTTISDPRC